MTTTRRQQVGAVMASDVIEPSTARPLTSRHVKVLKASWDRRPADRKPVGQLVPTGRSAGHWPPVLARPDTCSSNVSVGLHCRAMAAAAAHYSREISAGIYLQLLTQFTQRNRCVRIRLLTILR